MQVKRVDFLLRIIALIHHKTAVLTACYARHGG
jgi:hypothetical protein